MKSCVIFRTKDNYKIVTESETDTGLYIVDRPVFILSGVVSDEVLKEKLFLSLNSSSTGVKFPDNREDMKIWQKMQLSLMEEKSFDTLYKHSKSCLVRIKDGDLIVYPYVYENPKMGLIVKKEKIKNFTLSDDDKNQAINYIKENLT